MVSLWTRSCILTNELFSPIGESNSWRRIVQRIPSLHALRAFEAAARLGSFVRASEDLSLTPSAISHQIRALEQHFGRPLFVRAGRQVILTTDGERLLAALSQAFNIIHEACAELSPPVRKQDLRVHCTPSFAAKWLGPRLPNFLAQNPAINIRMSSSAEPFDLLRHDQIDIVVVYGSVRKSSGLTVQSLGAEEIAALCSAEYAKAHSYSKSHEFERITRLESSLSPVRWSDWLRAERSPDANRAIGSIVRSRLPCRGCSSSRARRRAGDVTFCGGRTCRRQPCPIWRRRFSQHPARDALFVLSNARSERT